MKINKKSESCYWLINKIKNVKESSVMKLSFTPEALFFIFFALVLITILNYGSATAWDCGTNCSRACGRSIGGIWVVAPGCKEACDAYVAVCGSTIGTGLSEEAWGDAGRVIYPAAAAVMNSRSPSGEPLTERLKYALRPVFGDLVDRVTMHWGITLLDEWSSQNIGINISGTESEGQTYGHDVFMRHNESTYNNRGETREMLKTLTHELVHVVQYRKWDSSLSNFGYHYFKKYKQANQSYENNEVEVEADQVAYANIEGVYNRYISYLDTLAGQVEGVLGELMVAPNEWYVSFNDNYDRCGANGKFVLRNSNDLAQLAEAVMNGRQVHFEFHCSDGLHIVDSWRWRYP